MKCSHSLPQEALLRTTPCAWRHSDILVPLMGVNSLLSLDDTSLEPDFGISHVFSRVSQICTSVMTICISLQLNSLQSGYTEVMI